MAQPTNLESLHPLIDADMRAVDQLMNAHMQSAVPTIPLLANHLVASGGKRIRPLICLSVARLCSYEGCHHVTLAACVEFIHTATLLHDDVVDESLLRRGKASANALWGNQASVLVGDFLFSRAFELMVQMQSLPVLSVLSAASSRIAEGEVLQLMSLNNISAAQTHYFDMIEAKTAQLFEASAHGAALLSGGTPDQVSVLKSYGRLLGLAFQVADDVLDYTSENETSGKTPGIDFQEGKVTLPVIYAFEKGDAQEKAFWVRTLQDGQQNADDLKQAQVYLREGGALEMALTHAKDFAVQARDMLKDFPDTPFKKILLDLATLSAERCA